VGQGNHVLDGGRGNFFRKKGRPIVRYRDTLRSSVRKRLNRSRCRFGCGMGQGIMCYMGSTGAKGRCHGNHFLAFDGL